MRKTFSALLFLVLVLWVAAAVAQSPGTGSIVLNPVAATSGTGVSNAALLDRPEIRVLRVDIQPGGVRNVHTHDDVQYHLFIPVSGTMQFEAEPEKPVDVAAWHAQFIKGGTRHGFKNAGATTATVIEVFVKK
jgi:quercetin dioxygenase-like cupin family protein